MGGGEEFQSGLEGEGPGASRPSPGRISLWNSVFSVVDQAVVLGDLPIGVHPRSFAVETRTMA